MERALLTVSGIHATPSEMPIVDTERSAPTFFQRHAAMLGLAGAALVAAIALFVWPGFLVSWESGPVFRLHTKEGPTIEFLRTSRICLFKLLHSSKVAIRR